MSQPQPVSSAFDLRVFVSSTLDDLVDYRQAAFNAIQSMGAHVEDMIFWPADERSGTSHSVDRVRHCDVLVLLVAHRYGHVAEGQTLSVTETEYRTARENEIPVLAFFLDDGAMWRPDHIEWERKKELDAFKRRVDSEVTRKTFRSPDELGRLVTQALASFRERRQALAAGTRRFTGVSLVVARSTALTSQPDATVHIGTTEDGLPMLLSVERSHDLAPDIENLASKIAVRSEPLDALLASFRHSVQAHANLSWASERVLPVDGPDGTQRSLYVTEANLSELFRSTLASLLSSASSRGIMADTASTARSFRMRTNFSAAAEVDSIALESEGGRNRFLGIDPRTGEVFSVGRLRDRWVQWRPFLFESIGAAFPAATYLVGGRDRTPLHELPAALMQMAIVGVGRSGLLSPDISIRVPRRDVVVLLADVARRIGERHAAGSLHGDIKPHNILLGQTGPVLIDAFDLAEGDISPGWTPHWSAPEQILGEPATAASDLYPLGRMIADVLGGELVGEVRKFKARPVGGKATDFDIFYNPSVHTDPAVVIADRKTMGAWSALARQCLRFAPNERPASAADLAQRIRELDASSPLGGEIRISMPGELRVATWDDGSQAVARVLTSRHRPAALADPDRWQEN